MKDFNYSAIRETGRFERWIARGIRNGPGPYFRYRCACFSLKCRSPRATSALVRGARDPTEHFLVRGECLESLAHCAAWYRPRTKLDRKVHGVVLGCLRDQHPNVRFWACFAADQMKLLSAKSSLRDLLGDQGLGCMGWTVDYEAREALKAIHGLPAWEGDVPAGKCPYDPIW